MNEYEKVFLPAAFEYGGENYDSEKFIKMRLKICHDGKNPNGSFFTVAVMDNAKESLKNSPILAHIVYPEGGERPDFGGHDMELRKGRDEDGETSDYYYYEQPIGVIPEDCNYTIEKDENGRCYVYADCLIWRGYTNEAEDIIERDKVKKLSMEISVDSGKYDRASKTYYVQAYRYNGITFLGDSYGTGMVGAEGKLVFSDMREQFLSDLKAEISQLSAVVPVANKKEEYVMNQEQIQAILGEYGKTLEELDFEITSTMTEEELREHFVSTEDSAQEPTTDFDLSSNIAGELSEAVSAYGKVVTWCGEMQRMYFAEYDTETQMVYFIDGQENYHLYGSPYKIEEGKAVIDFDARTRKKWAIVDFIEESDFTPVIFDVVANISTKAQEKLSEQTEEHQAYVEAHSHENEEVEGLIEYKALRLNEDHKAEIDDVVSNFADISEAEAFQPVYENRYLYTVNDFSKECFAIRGMTMTPKFAAAPKAPAYVPVVIRPDEDEPYGSLTRHLKS